MSHHYETSRQVEFCGECPHLNTSPRPDLLGNHYDYRCQVTGEWLGFMPVKSKECQLVSEQKA